MKIKVGVIFGGESVEHEVSIISAVQAMKHINEEKYDVIPIYISKDQIWYTGNMLKEIDIYRDMDLLKRFAKEVCNSIRMGYVEGPSEKHYKSKDSRLLINTRLYLESIRAYKEGKIWRVGIQPGYKTQHKGSNIELRSLAEIHEFGLRSRRIPARPVWFPTYQRLGGVHAFRKPIWDLMIKAVKRSKPKEVRISYGKLF